MFTFNTNNKRFKGARQMKRSRRGTYFVSGLLALTILWTLYSVRRVIWKNKPLPSQLRSQLQSQEISEQMAASKTDPGYMHQLPDFVCSIFFTLSPVMVQSAAGCWRNDCQYSSMVVTGAVDFHPGKPWTDTDGDLMQVSNPKEMTT